MKTVLYSCLLCAFIFSMATATAQQTKEFCVMKVTIAHTSAMSPMDSRIVISKGNADKPVVISLAGFGIQRFTAEDENQNNIKINHTFAELYAEGYKLISTASFPLPQLVEGYTYIFEK